MVGKTKLIKSYFLKKGNYESGKVLDFAGNSRALFSGGLGSQDLVG